MKNYPQLIARLRQQIEELTERLGALEQEWESFEAQQRLRQTYISSREILELLATRCGRTGSMASIKRWADEGHLGQVVEEREAFPLLAGKQGKKRHLYPRADVFRFLHQKGWLHPRYDVLDRVLLKVGDDVKWAVITAVNAREADSIDQLFVYQAQLEASGEVIEEIAENALLSASNTEATAMADPS